MTWKRRETEIESVCERDRQVDTERGREVYSVCNIEIEKERDRQRYRVCVKKRERDLN
jgi:hypothetical protein